MNIMILRVVRGVNMWVQSPRILIIYSLLILIVFLGRRRVVLMVLIMLVRFICRLRMGSCVWEL